MAATLHSVEVVTATGFMMRLCDVLSAALDDRAPPLATDLLRHRTDQTHPQTSIVAHLLASSSPGTET